MEKGVTKYRHSLVALYVDDLIIACSNQQLCNNLEKSFAKKFKMKILGETSHILEILIIHLKNMEYIIIRHRWTTTEQTYVSNSRIRGGGYHEGDTVQRIN